MTRHGPGPSRRRGGGGRLARHGRRIGATGDGASVTLATLGDVLGVYWRALNDALQLENSINRARCLGYSGWRVGQLYESSELERRVEALEAAQRGG